MYVRSGILFIGAVTAIIFAVFPPISVQPAFSVTVDRVLATVEGEAITYADYQQFLALVNEAGEKDSINEKFLKALIEEKIILQEAKRKGIAVSETEIDGRIDEFKGQNALTQEDFEKLLSADGMNIAKYRNFVKDDLTSLKMIHENIDSKIIITDKEITDLYEARRKDYPASPDLVEVKAIFVNLKEDATPTEITDLKLRALQIVEQVREGINFDFLVEQYSDEPLKSHEGVLGKFTKGDLIAALDSAVFSMKVGEVSDPVWVSEGAYILKVIKKEDEQYKPVEEVRAELYNILYKQKRETVFLEWIKSLWERSSIIINRS